MLTLLFIIAFAILAIGVYMVMSSSKEEKAQPREISMEHDIIKVRNIETGREDVYQKVNPEDIENNEPAWFDSDYEEDELNDLTLVERLRSPEVSIEEKRLIAEQLLGNGYMVNLSFASHAPLKSQVPFPDSGSEQVDPVTLRSLEPGEYYIRPEGTTGEDGDPQDSGDNDEDEDEGEDEGQPMQGKEAAPAEEFDVMGSLGMSEPTPQEDSEEDSGEEEHPHLTEEDGLRLEEAMQEYEPEVDLSFGKDSETGDSAADEKVRNELELMAFISQSYRKGLLSAALVHLAEERIPLTVESLEHTPQTTERIRREIQEFSQAKKTSLDSMSIESFGQYIREEVRTNEQLAAEKAEQTQQQQTPVAPKKTSTKKTAPKKAPAKKTSAKKPKEPQETVTVKLSETGGMNDFMWNRF